MRSVPSEVKWTAERLAKRRLSGASLLRPWKSWIGHPVIRATLSTTNSCSRGRQVVSTYTATCGSRRSGVGKATRERYATSSSPSEWPLSRQKRSRRVSLRTGAHPATSTSSRFTAPGHGSRSKLSFLTG